MMTASGRVVVKLAGCLEPRLAMNPFDARYDALLTEHANFVVWAFNSLATACASGKPPGVEAELVLTSEVENVAKPSAEHADFEAISPVMQSAGPPCVDQVSKCERGFTPEPQSLSESLCTPATPQAPVVTDDGDRVKSFSCRWCFQPSSAASLLSDVCRSCLIGSLEEWGGPQCRKSHRLGYRVARDLYECDGCRARLPSSSGIYECRRCDWTLCENCVMKEAVQSL